MLHTEMLQLKQILGKGTYQEIIQARFLVSEQKQELIVFGRKGISNLGTDDRLIQLREEVHSSYLYRVGILSAEEAYNMLASKADYYGDEYKLKYIRKGR